MMIRPTSPIAQARYRVALSVALNDPDAHFSPDERQILADAVAPDEGSRDYMLRVRLTEAEEARLKRMAGEAGMDVSEYVRGKIFG
jgi:hypothetical protein